AEAGRRDEALTAVEEAVEIRRRLAADNPAAYGPDLAASLFVTATILTMSGSPSQALRMTGQAVDLYRSLVGTMPYLVPQLYTVLELQAYLLAGLGRAKDAGQLRRWLKENPLPPEFS
ncbi:tetratricopeptide repeat protein, partial [Streptomyces collinus]|uniref:tetratricopeptide repeat protein n=1 Tax=Streptomyces collinus TaxID=42684 RepID=UPI0033D0412B